MTFLRHAPRHVHQSVIDYLVEQLTALGWLTAGQVPFGLTPITLVQGRPFVGGRLDNQIAAGTVAVSLGNELTAVPEELGGPLTTQEIPIFCDVFMDGESSALALATDIRDAFLGRHTGSRRSIPVIDQNTGLAVPDWRISFEDVQRIAPEHTFPISWHSVHVTAETVFQEAVY